MHKKEKLGGAVVLMPSTWENITDSVSSPHRPWTLAKKNGWGALQFTIALYDGGAKPNVSFDTLEDTVRSTAATMEFRQPTQFTRKTEGSRFMVSADFCDREQFVRVWHLTDGWNFAWITSPEEERTELPEAETIVSTIEFKNPKSRPSA